MNNLNYHCRVFIRVFQGEKCLLFFLPRFFSFLSHLFYVLHRLFSCHLNRAGTMGCMRLKGCGRMPPLLVMPCLTLINEGADTGRISESQGGIRGPEGTPRRRAGLAGEGHGHPSTPSGKRQWGEPSTGGSSEDRAPGGSPGPPSAWGGRASQDPCAGDTGQCSQPALAGRLPPSQTRCPPSKGGWPREHTSEGVTVDRGHG